MYAYSVTKQTAGAMAEAAKRHNEQSNKWRGLLALVEATYNTAQNFAETVTVMQGTKNGRHWRIWLTRSGAFVNLQLFIDHENINRRFYSDTLPVAMVGGRFDVNETNFFSWARTVARQLDTEGVR